MIFSANSVNSYEIFTPYFSDTLTLLHDQHTRLALCGHCSVDQQKSSFICKRFVDTFLWRLTKKKKKMH